MSRDLTFVFLCEGSSDSGLSPHLESLLVDFGATKATGMVDSGPGKLASRLKRMIAEESQFDLIFIHRDSDGPDRQPREEEIRQAIRDSGLQQPHVPVIPVQEMEAHGQVTKLDSWQRLERDIQSALAELGIR